jgi:hypothetical protein
MNSSEVIVGGTYLAKVTDKVVPVRIDQANPHGGWDATNLVTNKTVRIKSAQRLRGPAPDRAASPRSEAEKPAKASKGAGAKADKPAKPKEPSGLDAAHAVLVDAGEPMRCGDVVEKMLATGMWKTGGKTPSATIYAAIIREISSKGTAARFKKTDRGLFTASGK